MFLSPFNFKYRFIISHYFVVSYAYKQQSNNEIKYLFHIIYIFV